MSEEQMTDTLDEFEAKFQAACSIIIASARNLRARLLAQDLEAGREFGLLLGREMAKTGATEAEAKEYGRRIFLALMGEHQA